MLTQESYTTDNYNIKAWYYFQTDGQVTEAQPVDVNGENLREITLDLKAFFDESEETAEEFALYSEHLENGYAQVKLNGEFYEEDGEGGYTDETIYVTAVIEANEK